MMCDFHDGRCRVCGARRSPPYPLRRCTPGLGDMAAAALSAVGVTAERADRLARAAGFASCGCPDRRELMNRIGRRLGIGASSENPGLTGGQDEAEPNV